MVKYYHVSRARSASAILRLGLRSRGGKGFSPGARYRKRNYLWTSLSSAYFFMDEMAEYEEYGGAPVRYVVFEVLLPESVVLYGDEDMGLDISDGGYIRIDVPPENLYLLDTVEVGSSDELTVMSRKGYDFVNNAQDGIR